MTKITRRSVAASLALIGPAPALAAAPRPNILWLVSEDNDAWLGAYDDRLAQTPNIDNLAKRGVTYLKAYATAPVCAPSRFTILTGAPAESCAPANHMRAVAHLPSELRTYPQLLREGGYFCTNNSKTDYNCDVDPKAIWDVQGAAAHWRRAPKGRPFMAVFNYETSHETKIFQDTPGKVLPEQVQVPRYLPDTPEVRSDFASYYNVLSLMDARIGERLAELEADGLAEDTIIFYYSDNGGVLPRSKRYCYEEGLRCPLIIYAPPKWRHLLPAAPGARISAPVSFADLAPTVLTIAGVTPPPTMSGAAIAGRKAPLKRRYAFGMRNRMDERTDFVRTVTDGRWRYIRNYMPHRPAGLRVAFAWRQRSYRTWEALYREGRLNETQAAFFKPKPFEELYDLERDPDQVRNLAQAQPRHRERLSRALDRHMLSINDNGFIPEGMSMEGWRESQDRTAYPLPRLMALGAAAARADAGRLPQLAQALSDTNPVVRYWGALGLRLSNRSPDTRQRLLQALQDKEPRVRIIAAEALALEGRPEAFAELSRALGADNPWQVRLQALEALDALGSDAPAVRAGIEAAARDSNPYLSNLAKHLLDQVAS